MQCILLVLSVFFVVTSAVTLADFYRLTIAARRKSREPLSVQNQFPGYKRMRNECKEFRYPSYTVDDDGRFFILRPSATSSTIIPPNPSLKNLVPPELYNPHPKQIAPPIPDLPPPIRNMAFFINRRVYEIP